MKQVQCLLLMMMLLAAMLLCPMAAAEMTAGQTEEKDEIPEFGTVRVNVFVDKNKNAEQGKSEKALEGVTVSLYLVENGERQPVGSAVTGGTGVCTFEDLQPGQYQVDAVLPVGYGYSKRYTKSLKLTANMMSQTLERENSSELFTVNVGSTVECGIGAMVLSGISGQVWLDANGDGKHTADEGGLAGAVIEVNGTKNGSSYRVVTDESGYYALTQLKTGSYSLQVTLPDGYIFTVQG